MVRERLTLESRQIIEHMLNEKHSLSEIAAALMKNRSTIGREVKAHITIRRTGGRGFCYNNCVNRYTCTRTHICYPCKVSYKQILCRRCNLCNINCNKYEPAFWWSFAKINAFQSVCLLFGFILSFIHCIAFWMTLLSIAYQIPHPAIPPIKL